MSLGIVPKIACQRIFVLSDPGVPRTYVADCSVIIFDAKPEIVLFYDQILTTSDLKTTV